MKQSKPANIIYLDGALADFNRTLSILTNGTTREVRVFIKQQKRNSERLKKFNEGNERDAKGSPGMDREKRR